MRTPPARGTMVLLGLVAVAYLLTAATGTGDALAVLAGFIPGRVTGVVPAFPQALPVWLTPLTAAFLHAGVLHLIFNLVMLGYCGKAVEAVLGRGGLAVLFLIGAYAAAAGQFALMPDSAMPMIGVSGAASAIIAAYAVFYGARRPSTLHPALSRALHLAWLAAGWIGVQVLVALATPSAGLAVAVGAHAGGFVAGLLLAQPLLRWRYRKA